MEICLDRYSWPILAPKKILPNPNRRILAQNRTQAMLGFQKWGIMDINALKLNRQDFVENSLSLQVVAERIPCRREGQKLMAGVSALRENVEHTMPYITNLLYVQMGRTMIVLIDGSH